MIDEVMKFVQTVGVPSAMNLYLIWYYGKKFDRITELLTALAIHEGVYTKEG